jgi:O-methyltransferase involved in polyketide biosynthesis
MQAATPSRTALGVALRRAAHRLYDNPLVLDDPIALPILGRTRWAIHTHIARPEQPYAIAMRAFLVARSRYAEDLLAQAVAQGTRQYLILGAGLDTFAYRNPWLHLRVFEVDHPGTQLWKQQLLAEAQLRPASGPGSASATGSEANSATGIPIPPNLTFLPVDFETQSLAAQLAAHGFHHEQPTFVAWLGVVPYLTRPAFQATLGYLAQLAPGSGLVFDYGLPRASLAAQDQQAHDILAARVQAAGEPFQLYLTPSDVAAALSAFSHLEDLGTPELNARYFAHRTDHLAMQGSSIRFVSAWR